MEFATEYRNYILKDPLAVQLLAKIPWVLDTGLQGAMDRTLANEASRLADRAARLKFSLITPMFNTRPRFLEELIFSCKAQTWWNWELILVDDCSSDREHLQVAEAATSDPRIKLVCASTNGGISAARNLGIEAATGGYIGFVDHDDLLHPQTLGLCARTIHRDPSRTFIYTNEVKINEESTQVSEFLSKPAFDLNTLLRINFVTHFACIEAEFLRKNGTTSEGIFRSAYDGAEDHDLFLRLALSERFAPAHIPLFCYYWRKSAKSTAQSLDAKPEAQDRAMRLITEALPRTPKGNLIRSRHSPYTFGRNRFPALRYGPETAGRKLLVVVPFKDQHEMTLRCLERLEAQQTSLQVHVVAVDNNSSDPTTLPSLKRWMGEPRVRRYSLHSHPGPFNFAAINNEAVRCYGADADYVLFLNNDVELKSIDCLESMAGQLDADPQIAFVGIKLWYPGESEVQHGGMKVRPAIVGSGHYQIGHSLTDLEFVHDEHVAMGVTFAAAMTRKKVWDELGGLEEEFFPNGFGDVDIMLRALEAGYKNFYIGTLEGIHHESKSRLTQNEDLEFSSLTRMHLQAIGESRLRQLGYDLHLDWHRAPGTRDWLDIPLRYKLVDRLNDFGKRYFRFAHTATKRLAKITHRQPRL